jgi:hypothetical protein
LASALVTLWSARSRVSTWVAEERRVAKENGLQECLIRFPNVRLPYDWPMYRGQPDKTYEHLEGARLIPSPLIGGAAKVEFDSEKFFQMVLRVHAFALVRYNEFKARKPT